MTDSTSGSGLLRPALCCKPSPADTPRAPEEPCDDSAFSKNTPTTHAAIFRGGTPADEATAAVMRFLQLLDARHEALIQRVEERLHHAVAEHLDNVTDVLSKVMKEEDAPCMTVPASLPSKVSRPSTLPPTEKVNLNGTSLSTSEETGSKSIMNEGQNDAVSNLLVDAEESCTTGVKNAKDAAMSPKDAESGENQVSVDAKPQKCELEIVQAEGLAAMDSKCCGHVPVSDPYVKVLVRERDHHNPHKYREVFRTHTKNNTVDPVWNSYCKFKIPASEEEVVIEIWDEDEMSPDDLLGRVTLFLSDIGRASGALAGWFDITPQEDCPNASGKIMLQASLPNSKKAQRMLPMNVLGGEPMTLSEDKSEKTHPFPMIVMIARLQELASNPRFDAFFCGCIVVNAIAMLLEQEYHGRKAKAIIGLEEPGSDDSDMFDSTFRGINVIFAMIFLIELLIRLVAFGYRFLKQPSNWLDIVIVGSCIFEVSGAANFVNLTFLRLARLSKLARILRIALLANFCDPLRILMKAIYTGFDSLFWSFVLLALIEIVAGLFITQILTDAIADETLDIELRRFIYTYYGTTSRTTLTMFQITMAPGAWGVVGRPIIEDVHPGFAWFFILYVGGVSFAVIRIITALFLRQTMQVAASDEELQKTEKIKSQRRYTENIRELFVQADKDGTGEVSFEEFQTLMQDTQFMAWLAVLELNPKNASYIFELADDGDGRLTLDEFLSCFFRLKGAAQQIDMVMIQQDTKKMKRMLQGFDKQLHDLTLLCEQFAGKARTAS